MAAIISGSVTRLVLFALVLTTYGVENTLLYIPNHIFSASFDGIPTILSVLVSLISFVTVALATQESHTSVALDIGRTRRTPWR